jgi:hypothetical protein
VSGLAWIAVWFRHKQGPSLPTPPFFLEASPFYAVLPFKLEFKDVITRIVADGVEVKSAPQDIVEVDVGRQHSFLPPQRACEDFTEWVDDDTPPSNEDSVRVAHRLTRR